MVVLNCYNNRNATPPYEKMSTLLNQVEACLNSRPISVINVTAPEPLPLTPGHFLIGEPLVNVPDKNSMARYRLRWVASQTRNHTGPRGLECEGGEHRIR